MDDLIFNQKKIPADQWRYGLRSSAATGCGWIATHNALHLLGYHENIPDLISYYEHQFPLVHGTFGTTVWGPALCFHQWGFPTNLFADPRKFDAAARLAPVCILFFWWKKGPRVGAHFAAVQYRDGRFWGYNTFSDSVGPDCLGTSLQSFLTDRGYFGAVLTTIQRKNR